MVKSNVVDYDDPVRRLLDIGETSDHAPDTWPDYAAKFGFGPEHIPTLIRMACDRRLHESTPPKAACWAPMHAWRTLAQMRATEAIEPLVALVTARPNDELIIVDVPLILGLLGSGAIAPVQALLETASNDPDWPRGAGIDALKHVAVRHPEARDQCVAIFTKLLATHATTTDWDNGCIVSALIDLKAIEAIDAIRAAFAAKVVAHSVAGDLEDVEIEFGLRTKRVTPKPHYNILLDNMAARPRETTALPWSVRPVREGPKIGRNDPCLCGSGKKYKKCCGA